jgi:hypothetical protein
MEVILANARIDQLRDVLTRGKRIIILGWSKKDHNDFTRQLSEETVRFLEEIPRDLPEKVGAILATRAVGHYLPERLQKQFSGPTFKRLKSGDVRSLLRALRDILLPPPRLAPSATQLPKDVTRPSTAIPQKPEVSMTKEAEFKRRFLQAAGRSADSTVSRYVLAAIRKEIFGNEKTVAQLLAAEWVVPVVAEKKVGSYKAGPKMLEEPPPPEVPTDPIGYARYLISRKDDLESRLADHKASILAIEADLKKIAEAEEYFAKLEQLMKK